MNDSRFKRLDDRYLDFEDININSLIIVDNDQISLHWHDWRFLKDEMWIVVFVEAVRPRKVQIKNMQRGVTRSIRIDELLRLDDLGIITVTAA